MVLERREMSMRLEEKGLEDIKEGIISGYASVFDVKDSYGTKIMKGAFTETLEKEFANNKVKFLWQHRSDSPIGKILELDEDDTGLYGKAKVSQTQLGLDTLTLVSDGAVDGLSIGFWIIASQWRDDDTGELLEQPESWWDVYWNPIYWNATEEILVAKLAEYSVVTFPANGDALIDDVRSAGATHSNPRMARRQARMLRSAGQNPEEAIQMLFAEQERMKKELEAVHDKLATREAVTPEQVDEAEAAARAAQEASDALARDAEALRHMRALSLRTKLDAI